MPRISTESPRPGSTRIGPLVLWIHTHWDGATRAWKLHVSATVRPGPRPGKSTSKSALSKLRPKRPGMERIPRFTQEITSNPTTSTVPRTISRRHLSQKSFINDQLPRGMAYKLHSPTGAGEPAFRSSADTGLPTRSGAGRGGDPRRLRHYSDRGQNAALIDLSAHLGRGCRHRGLSRAGRSRQGRAHGHPSEVAGPKGHHHRDGQCHALHCSLPCKRRLSLLTPSKTHTGRERLHRNSPELSGFRHGAVSLGTPKSTTILQEPSAWRPQIVTYRPALVTGGLPAGWNVRVNLPVS